MTAAQIAVCGASALFLAACVLFVAAVRNTPVMRIPLDAPPQVPDWEQGYDHEIDQLAMHRNTKHPPAA